MNFFDAQYYGGHKLTLADIAFIQAAYQEAFNAFSNLLSDTLEDGLSPSYLIKGCTKSLQSAGVWSISEGFIVLSGEVLYVPNHTVSFINENDPLYWRVDQTIEYPSPVEYKDFQTRDIHLKRIAKVTTSATPISFSLTQIKALIDRRLRGSTGTIAPANGWTGTIQWVRSHGRVSFYGAVQATSNTTHGNVICQIPAELTPFLFSFGYLGSAQAISSLESGFIALVLASSGQLAQSTLRTYLNGSTPTSQVPWHLTLEPLNLTSSPPRVANLKVLNPVNIPPGSDTVVYNLNGMSWDIAPE